MKNLLKTFEIKNEKTKISLQEIVWSLLISSILFFCIYGFKVFQKSHLDSIKPHFMFFPVNLLILNLLYHNKF